MAASGQREYVAIAKPVMLENNQMSLAFERRLLEGSCMSRSRVSCTLITGFLGSGKTTLVRHILRNRGDLRIAVLVNEYSEVDIDGVIVHNAHSHASLGLPSAELASGCACCTKQNDMKQAVKDLMVGGHDFDHLIIETSGVADPGPLALMLEELNVQLHLIVTVVDAENLLNVLDNPIARRQLSFAEIVLINKCDLASLGTISDVEDKVEAEIGNVRVVRCRFAQVPLPLVVDVIEAVSPAPSSMSNDDAGVMSHEKVITQTTLRRAADNQSKTDADSDGTRKVPGSHSDKDGKEDAKAERRRKLANANRDIHIHEELGFTSLVFKSDEPILLSAFQDFVRNGVLKTHGLLRAKGVLWFQEDRNNRYVFQYSGKKRAETVCDSVWESPPSVKVVFIGRDSDALKALRSSLSQAVSPPSRDDAADVGVGKAKQFAAMVAADQRFQLLSSGGALGADNIEGTQGGSELLHKLAPSLVRFGMVGYPLKSITEAVLNTDLMCTVNASGALFLTAATPPHCGHFLQLAFGATSESDEAAQDPSVCWKIISDIASRVLIRAHRDVCPCRCDYTRSA
ncbi:hypothetical protein CBR_g5605 [Chara braunii]|uniref:CobW C-terminal domain-containing protein n=1 Tax=Chara braunii TaxID=69332 RepID=A0A388JRI0_CHABU|nr:hypothetical protein CBR_g5605 [Chara braunii]|eukprot:GBG60429.1 hypothetical protein CBR_g5605 [Chara braunii]